MHFKLPPTSLPPAYLFLGFLLFISLPAQAARTWYDGNPSSIISYTTWDGSTPPTPAATDSSGCVRSIRNRNTGARNFGVYTNLGNPGTGTLFTLVNILDSGDTLDISLDYSKGGTTVTLDNNSSTGNGTFTGGNSCGTATIDMNVTLGAMLAATGGATYRSTIDHCVVRGTMGNSAGRCSYTGDAVPPSGSSVGETISILFEIYVPTMAIIDGLDNINMSYTPGSNATGTDAFCTGRNSSGNVKISASSSKTTSGGTFMMMDGAPGPTVDYSVTVSGKTITEGAAGIVFDSSDGVREDLNCTSLSGMDIVVTSQDNDVKNAAAGTYSDTLTLTIEAN